MLSPYHYWQFWRNTADADVVPFLKLFTTLPREEIMRLAQLRDAEVNDAKKILARHATALLHGPDAAADAERTAELTFQHNTYGEDLPMLTVRIGDGILSANTQLGFSSSNAQARQYVRDGAVYLGDRRITDPDYRLSVGDFDDEGRTLLRTGKKKRGILTLGSE